MLGTLQRGPVDADARDPARRRRRAVRPFHAHARDPPRHRQIGQDSPAPDFGRPHPALPMRRCRGLTRRTTESEQRRRPPILIGPREDLAVVEAQRQRDRCGLRAPLGSPSKATPARGGRGARAPHCRGPARSCRARRTLELSVARCRAACAAYRRRSLQQFVETRDRDPHFAVKAAIRGQAERAAADRERSPCCERAFFTSIFPPAFLDFAETLGPRLGRRDPSGRARRDRHRHRSARRQRMQRGAAADQRESRYRSPDCPATEPEAMRPCNLGMLWPCRCAPAAAAVRSTAGLSARWRRAPARAACRARWSARASSSRPFSAADRDRRSLAGRRIRRSAASADRSARPPAPRPCDSCERRLRVRQFSAGLGAAHLDPERKAAEALIAAAIDAPGRASRSSQPAIRSRGALGRIEPEGSSSRPPG